MKQAGFLSLLLCSAATSALAVESAREPVLVQEPMLVEASRVASSPATVSTLDVATLAPAEATLPDLSARAANFFESTSGARGFNDTFAVRGLTNTPIFGDPSVGFYVDDVPLGSGFTFPSELTGFAQAELRRGPGQNTLFGRAGSAGVVTLATPAAAPAGGDIRASYGNFDARSAAISAGSPAGGTADAYAAAAYAARDGFITNTTLHRAVDDQESLSGLARIRVRPAPAAELSLLVTGLRVRDGAQPLVPLGGPMFTVARSAEGETDIDAWNAGLTAAFATPLGRLSATTSFNDWELGPYSNTLDFGFAELSNRSTLTQRNANEELKFVSDPHAALPWQAGAFYSDGRTTGAFTRAFGPFLYEQSRYRIGARDLAAYGQATYPVSPDVSVTAGLRVERSRKTLARENLLATTAFSGAEESTALLPKLGADWRVRPDLRVFASLGAGYKPGGFSGFTDNAALAAFGPERTTALEAGVTQGAAGGALTTTVRVFAYDITGYQIERSFATGAVTGDDYLVVNAPKARSLGGELELAWKPFPGLTATATLGATDVTLRDFRDPYTGVSYDGRRAPYVPVFDASVSVDYRHSSGFFAGADVSSNGRTYYTESEDLAFGQRAYALLGARAGYDAGRWRLSVFGENLADVRYYSAIAPGTGHGTPGAPRTYGVEFRAGW